MTPESSTTVGATLTQGLCGWPVHPAPNTEASVLTFWDLVGFTAVKADDRYCPLAILKSAAWILTGSMSSFNGQPVKAGPKCFFFFYLCQIPNYLRKWGHINWVVSSAGCY